MSARLQLQGKRFSHLSVVEFAGTDKRGHSLWRCLCDCGNEKTVPAHKLVEGGVKSCGCMRHKCTHGKTDTRLYHIWRTMKSRCFVETSAKYNIYGGRGITVCEEWKNSFQCFYDWSMANGYTDEMSIDRIDNDGDYQPSNCQWITMSENSRKSWEHRRNNTTDKRKRI